jgi:multiple sugar transport system substrate-binding protein
MKSTIGKGALGATSALLAVAGIALTVGNPVAHAAQSMQLTEEDYYGTTSPGAHAVANDFKEFSKLHPAIQVERQTPPSGTGYLQKMLQEAITHTLPGFLMLDNPWVQQFAATGVLMPLNGNLKGNLSPAHYLHGPMTTVTYNGKIYGLPVGSNDLALFYNKKMFAAHHLTPPRTWAEMLADAKILTHGNVYGFGFAALHNATWQFEPWFWTNGAHLRQVNSPQGVQALSYLVQFVHDGYAPRAVLSWGQGHPELQFAEGHLAMMENGPWFLSTLNAVKGLSYGVVPIPVPRLGMKPISPLGGEVWTIPSASPAQESAAWQVMNYMETPSVLAQTDAGLGYIPDYIPAEKIFLKQNPQMNVFADELPTARARTIHVGKNYPAISQAVTTAIQAAISGSMTPKQALDRAQQTIDSILK